MLRMAEINIGWDFYLLPKRLSTADGLHERRRRRRGALSSQETIDQNTQTPPLLPHITKPSNPNSDTDRYPTITIHHSPSQHRAHTTMLYHVPHTHALPRNPDTRSWPTDPKHTRAPPSCSPISNSPSRPPLLHRGRGRLSCAVVPIRES